ESPDVSINFDGNQYPGPDDKMPKRFILIPQMMPSGLAILSDYISGKDPEDYSGKFPASTMLGEMSLIIEGAGKNEIELGDSKVKVRSFDFTLSSKEMKEDITGRLDQFEDGSFCGIKMGEDGNAYVVSAPAGGAEEAVNEIQFSLETSADTLSAKMILPKDASFENPAPLIIICNGPESMADNSFKFNEYLASELSDKGIASVFYSSREDSVTMQTVIDDAVLACRESNNAPGTVPGKVMLFGSGLGTMALAEIAQNVASDSLNVTGLLSVGGVWSTGATFHAEIPQNEEAFWFDSFLGYEPAIAGYANPVLLFHGANDQEVPSAESTNLKSDLSDSGNIKVLCNILDGTNHFLQKSDTGNVDEYETLPPECARGVVDRMAKFISSYNK
ncbi:alpha/beta hydrolase, partial [bacterium]|nr:alpha/beta hydrolase [bacterium]